MNVITLDKDNLEREHICCAISNNTDCQVAAKKQWLAARLDDGLVFKKGDVRGKCFIEYIPAEKAWVPIEAEEYMYIDCFWVSGQYKGRGNANLLFDECVKDSKAKGKKGLAALSSPGKKPFLSDPGYLKHKGFRLADTAAPYFELLYLPFEEAAEKPRFKAHLQTLAPHDRGFELYYTRQCPFTAKYVPLAEACAKSRGIPFRVIPIESAREAQDAPTPFTAYSLFYNGTFVTHEILSEKKLEKIFGATVLS